MWKYIFCLCPLRNTFPHFPKKKSSPGFTGITLLAALFRMLLNSQTGQTEVNCCTITLAVFTAPFY
jgi:hypothetical protein